MSSIESVEVKVDELIGEIRQLKIERDGVDEEKRMEVLRLQSDIFRKFGMVDCLLLSIATEESQEEIRRLKEKVLEEKKMAQAELEDLEKMEFPQMEGKKENPEFHMFMNLPPEVRIMILGYLTSASDKLNVLKAIPDAVELTGWKIPDLKLVQIVSVLRKENKLESQHLLNLTQVSRTVRDFIYSEFYNNLDTPFQAEGDCCQSYALNRFLHKQPTVPLKPIPVDVNIHIWSRTMKTRTLRRLAKYGNDLWACTISYSAEMPGLKNLQAIRDCLLLMPNLRQLNIRNITYSCKFIVDAAYDEFPLPDLPNLVTLEISGAQNMQFDAKLLRKYGPGVQNFKRLIEYPLFGLRNLGRLEAPQLSTLHLEVRPDLSLTVRMTSDLERFVGSPLRSVSVLGGCIDYDEGDFEYLFTTLSQYGSTLEQVNVQLLQGYEEDLLAVDFLRMVDVKFPKVKTLAIEGTPKTWAILLSFPAVEMLTLKKDGPASDAYFQDSGLLELSWIKKEMYVSHIWKLLPDLKTINFVRGDGNGNVEKYSVDRKQCWAFQKKSVELPPTGH